MAATPQRTRTWRCCSSRSKQCDTGRIKSQQLVCVMKFSFIRLMLYRSNTVKGDRFQMTSSSFWTKPISMERRKCHIMLQCEPWFLGRRICLIHLSHTGLDVWLKWRPWSNNITRSAEVYKSEWFDKISINDVVLYHCATQLYRVCLAEALPS